MYQNLLSEVKLKKNYRITTFQYQISLIDHHQNHLAHWKKPVFPGSTLQLRKRTPVGSGSQVHLIHWGLGTTALDTAAINAAQTHRYSQTSALECLGSETIWFSTRLFIEKMSNCPTKLRVPTTLSCWDLYDWSRDWSREPQATKESRFSNCLLERIKFKNQGSTVFNFSSYFPSYDKNYVLLVVGSWKLMSF